MDTREFPPQPRFRNDELERLETDISQQAQRLKDDYERAVVDLDFKRQRAICKLQALAAAEICCQQRRKPEPVYFTPKELLLHWGWNEAAAYLPKHLDTDWTIY